MRPFAECRGPAFAVGKPCTSSRPAEASARDDREVGTFLVFPKSLNTRLPAEQGKTEAILGEFFRLLRLLGADT
jgi:hypothetical protein